MKWHRQVSGFFFFNDTATTEIYTLSLHDALPISLPMEGRNVPDLLSLQPGVLYLGQKFNNISSANRDTEDRKSTRLNSSHGYISYAVFCLKKKNAKH